MTALSFSGGAAVQWVGRMSAAMRSLVIPVSDMGAAKKVYTAVLGDPHTDTPSYVGYNVHGFEVALAP